MNSRKYFLVLEQVYTQYIYNAKICHYLQKATITLYYWNGKLLLKKLNLLATSEPAS